MRDWYWQDGGLGRTSPHAPTETPVLKPHMEERISEWLLAEVMREGLNSFLSCIGKKKIISCIDDHAFSFLSPPSSPVWSCRKQSWIYTYQLLCVGQPLNLNGNGGSRKMKEKNTNENVQIPSVRTILKEKQY